MEFIKKNWSNILFVILLVLLFIPQTGTPIRVFVNRLIAFSPSEEKNPEQLSNAEWRLVDENGQLVNFASLSDKPILVNFWATWCPPCVAEMPSLDKLHAEFKNDVHFVFISNEESKVVRSFLDKAGWDIPTYKMASPPPMEFETRSVPATFVLDKEGRIVVSKIGSANWYSNSFRERMRELI